MGVNVHYESIHFSLGCVYITHKNSTQNNNNNQPKQTRLKCTNSMSNFYNVNFNKLLLKKLTKRRFNQINLDLDCLKRNLGGALTVRTNFTIYVQKLSEIILLFL